MPAWSSASRLRKARIVWQIRDLVGPSGAEAIQTILKSAREPSTSAFAAIASFLVLLVGASGVFVELRDSLNDTWEIHPKQPSGIWNLISGRFVSFAMVLGIGFLLLVSLVVSAGLSFVEEYFGSVFGVPGSLVQVFNFAISLLVISALFSVIYKAIPDTFVRLRDVIPGGVVTALLFTAGKYVIGLYLGKAGVGSAYGAFGSLIVLLVWVYYSAQIFLFGAEFTRVWAAIPVARERSLRRA